MANKYRGEIAATLDGASYTLCLTLGALAELESAFGTDDMLGLAGRFSQGRISARDCVRIIGAGLRGAGHDVTDTTVATMRGDDGAADRAAERRQCRHRCCRERNCGDGESGDAAAATCNRFFVRSCAAGASRRPAGATAPFPWSEVMAVGLGVLALPPSEFWRMTPKEIDAALRGRFGHALRPDAPSRADLETLMQLYPDRTAPCPPTQPTELPTRN